MTPTALKIARMKALAESVGAEKVAQAPSRRPPNPAKIHAMRARSMETVSQELKRIVNVPLRYVPDADVLEAVSQHYFQAQAFADGWRLLPTQAESLLAYSEVGGAFLPLAVGGGKTLTSLLIANDAYTQGKQKIMLIVPPALATQLCDTDIKHWRPLTIFNTPIHRLHGLSKIKRQQLAQSGRKGIYIFTYSLLSSADAHEILEAVNPDLIILDEAHSVSKRSARTRRFTQYLHECHPQVVALSGTMTQKSLMDYFEIARASLGQNNFIPNAVSLTEEWSKLIDTTATSVSDFRSDEQSEAGPLKYVLDWARKNFRGEVFDDSVLGFRKAFKHRLITTPGVVCSSGHDLPYSLYINNEPVENYKSAPGWDKVEELVKQLDTKWLTPNGDEIEEAMHLHRWKMWIQGAGFYTELYWPDTDWMMERGIYHSTAEAKDILELSQMYHERNMDYARELRAWIRDRGHNGMDTPMLIGKSMSDHGSKHVGEKLYKLWKDWHESDFDGRIERNKRAVRLCNFKIEKAVQYAKNLPKDEGCLIWYDNDEVGEWANERLEEEGLNHLFCKAGEQYNRILNDREKCKGRIILLTINAHFQGRNLQFDRNQFYLQWPRSASRAEQSMGRQHRIGLEYDEVFVTTCNTTEFDHILFAATLNDSCYVDQSQGNRQKLMYATYTPKPKIVPFEVLVDWQGSEAGLRKLDTAGKLMLQRTFGD
jgi:hypothetical protein